MKGRPREELTLDNILKRISEYDIYRYYLGRDFKINKSIKSPFHNDKSPSFMVGNKNGFLYHIDFSDSRFRGNVVDFVSQITGTLGFNNILLRIDGDFGLGIVGVPKDYKAIIQDYKHDKKEPTPTLIQCKLKRFDSAELAYWKQYGITETELKQEDVYSVSRVWVNDKQIGIKNTEMVFGYLYNDKWKIYRPMAAKKVDKWMNNVPNAWMDGVDKLVKGNILITKSKKDKMVIKKVFPNTCSVQSEGVSAISPENVELMKKLAPTIYINFDNDETGKKYSWHYTTEFGFKHINVPDIYLEQDIKDFSDMAKSMGLQAVENYFKLKSLI